MPLLDRLKCAGGDFVSLGELGANLDQVRRDLGSLTSFGFGIALHPYRGAAYVGPAQRLCPDQIEHSLATRSIGKRIAVWNRVTSTNDLAARAATSASNDGLVVMAEEQTAGRGRRGHSWTAPANSSILMSVVLFPPRHLAPGPLEAPSGCAWLTMLGAVAAAEVVTEWTGRQALIKWPNDVRIEGKKIAGVLVERVPAPRRSGSFAAADPGSAGEWRAVIGIGLNVNVDVSAMPHDLVATATSIQIEGGGLAVDRSELARGLIRRLDHWYEASRTGGVAILNAPWQIQSEHRDRSVRVTTPTGTIGGRLLEFDLRAGLTLAIEEDSDREINHGGTSRTSRVPIADILALENANPDRHDFARQDARLDGRPRCDAVNLAGNSRGTGTATVID